MARRRTPRSRRDWRLAVFFAVVAALGGLSWLIASWLDSYHADGTWVSEPEPPLERKETVEDLLRPLPATDGMVTDPRIDPAAHQQTARRQEIDARFRQGAAMLHAGRYDEAATALHRVLELAPTLVEAHVNMGFAMLGLERDAEALAFFEGAADLDPMQTNAYYGMAVAHEGLGDLRRAIETMEAYLHLEKEDAYYLRLANTAVWEWRAELEAGGLSPAVDPASSPH